MDLEAAALRNRLHQSNKRAQKSCGPCRSRKVKCNRASPCVRCVRSGYPNLCIYDARTRASGPTASGPSIRRTDEARLDVTMYDLNRVAPETEASHTRASTTDDPELDLAEDQNDRRPFLGANSLPQFLEDEATSSEDATRQGARDAMMPMLGTLAPPVPGYPFYVPSEGLQDQAIARLYQSLPPSKEIIRLVRIYQMDIHPFMPLLVKDFDFETQLFVYVQRRWMSISSSPSGCDSETHDLQRGLPMAWMSTLFAVMACGAQFDIETNPMRQKQSSLYVSCAFEALRLANSLTRPTVHCVQAMLLIGLVLQNDMRPQAAWMLLGNAIRMAQSLGLHRVKDGESLHRLLWLALLRQDGLLGACFDRTTTSPFGTTQMDPYHPSGLSHKAAMDHMIDLILRSGIVAEESQHPDLGLRRDLANAVDAIKRRTQGHHTGPPEPAGIQAQCLIHHLKLQLGFVKAWVCRPALRNFGRPNTGTPDTSLQEEVAAICLQGLRECLYGFVRLNSLCNYATRSWSVIHNGLSSSLLLALTGELRRDPRLHAALGELLDIFEVNHVAPENEDGTTDNGTNLSRAYARAVIALRKMYVRDSHVTRHEHSTPATSSTVPRQRHRETVNPADRPISQVPLNRDLPHGVNVDQSFLQDFDFMSGVPPLDAFDTILWPSYQDAEFTAGDAQDFSWV